VMWAVILTGVAFIFINVRQSVVEIALGIASITYGGLLGTFLLGLFFPKVNQQSAIIAFSCGIITMLIIVLVPIILKISALVHWTWFVAIGTTVTIIVGNVVEKIRRNAQ
jgi:SSS family solute:Na+ symporter